MRKILTLFLSSILCFTTPTALTAVTTNVDSDTIVVVSELSQMYRASMTYIFRQQKLINQRGGDKSALFGRTFINNVKQTYKKDFSEAFPKQDHVLKRMLVQVMVEVMEDNRTLITDDDIKAKGFIPAIFAFQISEKLSTKGLGVKIKFTNNTDKVRNKLNTPDEWETKAMDVIQRLKLPIYFDHTTTFDGRPSYRHFAQVKLTPMCLACHGTPANNPLNANKDKSKWTDIDTTGFPMENWQLTDFGGGVSVTIYKKDF